ncbi:HEAT repeat domain-containing protein [Lysobacter hankyongensis]|uniref:HEAT repeat domain-containing protein n=1 Tax=Lysobacter hankyongensis TaxID=1176535 RepID=A0ABP9BZF2_9GAMM
MMSGIGARSSRLALSAVVALVATAGAWVAFDRHQAADAVAREAMPAGRSDRADATAVPAVANDPRRGRAGGIDVQELMRRYTLETELDKRGALLATLQANPDDEVKRFALQLAASRDPVARREGLELLKAFPLSDTDVRGFLVSEIDREQDPAMLTTLVDMLSPTMIASEDAAPLVARLTDLRAHPDPQVRAASVLQTSQWDRGDGLENVLHEAMRDPDERVRLAAIGGITAERVRSDRLKEILLAIASDPRTGGEERNRALFALEGFALNRAEYEIYRQAAQLGTPGDGHGH